VRVSSEPLFQPIEDNLSLSSKCKIRSIRDLVLRKTLVLYCFSTCIYITIFKKYIFVSVAYPPLKMTKKTHTYFCMWIFIIIIYDSWQIFIHIYCNKWHKTYKKYTCKFNNIIHSFTNIIQRYVREKLCKMYAFTNTYVQRFAFKSRFVQCP